MLWFPGNLIDGSVDRMSPLVLKPTMSTKCWQLIAEGGESGAPKRLPASFSSANGRSRSFSAGPARRSSTPHELRVGTELRNRSKPVRPGTIDWDRKGMRRQGRLGGSSPGHATAIGAEDSHWQGYLLSPDSPLSSGESA